MRRILGFLRSGHWDLELRTRALPERLALGGLRIAAHTLRQYGDHQVGIRASGLALVTLLSIVPLLAVAFAIASAFGFRESLEGLLARNTQGLPEHLAQALRWIEELVRNTSFKALGGVGTATLVWTSIALFSRVEESLNFTWRTRGQRAWLRRVASFLALVLLVPAFMAGALAFGAALASAPLVERLRLELPWLMPLYDAGLWLVPHVMAWIALAALYKFMPDTEVRWRAAVPAGVIAGSSLLAMHAVYVRFQIGVGQSNAIYATLAALPLLLVYLQLAWTVVLLGAELGYAVQNLHVLGPARDPSRLPFALRERLALRLVERTVAAHERGDGPLPLTAEAQAIDVPREWLERVVDELERHAILVRTAQGGVLPGRPGARLSVGDVALAVRGDLDARLSARLALSPPIEQSLARSLEAGRREAGQAFST
ncbi:MAG: YihY family inner membrane protein [Planctomycetes bacterium]|nr:YihY family inner membrane protein [Planctomycetota bacterium]